MVRRRRASATRQQNSVFHERASRDFPISVCLERFTFWVDAMQARRRAPASLRGSFRAGFNPRRLEDSPAGLSTQKETTFIIRPVKKPDTSPARLQIGKQI